jgi:hypothetical protein
MNTVNRGMQGTVYKDIKNNKVDGDNKRIIANSVGLVKSSTVDMDSNTKAGMAKTGTMAKENMEDSMKVLVNNMDTANKNTEDTANNCMKDIVIKDMENNKEAGGDKKIMTNRVNLVKSNTVDMDSNTKAGMVKTGTIAIENMVTMKLKPEGRFVTRVVMMTKIAVVKPL